MIKFTKEEISLCKQVTEKHRRKIEYGSWYWCEKVEKTYLCTTKKIEDRLKGHFPLWTISDYLEFLGKKNYTGRIDFGEASTHIYIFGIGRATNWVDYPNYKGKTPLEACLKAVLAVLEEEEGK